MGFHANRQVVGLRSFIGMALVLGLGLAGFGYVALFHADLTDLDPHVDDRPNIVLVFLADPEAVSSPAKYSALVRLRRQALEATDAYTVSSRPRRAMDACLTIARTPHPGSGAHPQLALATALQSHGYHTAGYVPDDRQYDQDAGSVEDVEREQGWPDLGTWAASYIRAEGLRRQPFFLAVPCGEVGESAAAVNTKLAAIVSALESTELAANTAVLVIGVAANRAIELPARWRVLFLVRHPRRFVRPAVFPSPVWFHDVGPTVLELAGVRDATFAHPFAQDLLGAHLRGDARSWVYIWEDGIGYFGGGDRWVVQSAEGRPTAVHGGAPDPRVLELLERTSVPWR